MLQTLELANIRSYTNGLFEFTSGVNIVVGPNASGKTNLLEAVYMCMQGSGFKSDDAQMLRYGQQWARIDAQLIEHTRSIKLQTNPLRKIFVLDDIEKKRLASDKKLPVVLFEPSHMLLLAREPERRRAYIDTVLSHIHPAYPSLLKAYKRTLAQRNRLLKLEDITEEHLFVWDLRLIDVASKIVEHRMKLINMLSQQLSQNYQSVSGNDEQLSVVYESKHPPEQYAESMLRTLKNEYSLDRARGFTGTGPHRDDLKIILEAHDARESASRGETRSIVLALKIAELSIIEKQLDKKPLLLLDDVFSELDGKRRRTLSETLSDYQTIITTTDADVVVEHFSESCTIIPLSPDQSR